MRQLYWLVLSLGFLLSSAADAAVVTREFAFSATDFEYFYGLGPAPVDPATGNVTVTFDDASDQINVPGGVTFRDFNFVVDTVSAVPAYTYLSMDDLLFVGTLCTCGSGDVTTLGPNSDGFVLGILGPTGPAPFGFFLYSQADFDAVAFADTLNVASVPEPATWSLMIVAFAALGAMLRRTRASPLARMVRTG